MPEDIQVLCRNPDCDYADSKKCIDGLGPSAHPDSKADEADPDEFQVESTDAQTDFVESLWTGERLNCAEASDVLRLEESRVLAIIGPTKSGKTSLICSVYELLQKEVRSDFHFAGSRTLFAFERACHNSRAESLRHEPVMEHTEHNPLPFGVSFYHLRLADKAGRLVSILFADRTGEDYKAACDDPSVSDDFVEIQRADSVTILVNGELVIDNGQRHNVRSSTELILQGLRDGGVLSGRQKLLIVLTKQDKIEAEQHHSKDKAYEFFDTLVKSIQHLYCDNFVSIEPFRVAASPKNTLLSYGHGVPELMSIWYQSIPVVPAVSIPPVKATREMGRISE